jgi:hypothetical protein
MSIFMLSGINPVTLKHFLSNTLIVIRGSFITHIYLLHFQMVFDEDEDTTLNRLVILGKAAPERLSDGRQTVCTGAWSPERGFIRLYPCYPDADLFSRWDIVNVEVERNDRDTRYESWKIKGREQEQEDKIDVVGKCERERRKALLHAVEDDCVEDINQAKRSLGVIRPEEIHGLEYEDWDDSNKHVQQTLFEDDSPQDREDFEHEIKVKFRCPDCQTQQQYHRCTLLEWGAYVGMSKTNTNSTRGLENMYNLHDEEFQHWIFMGNMYRERTQFVAINLIWLKHDGSCYQTFEQYPKVGNDFEEYKEEMLSET